jgi:hypothetical protein
MISAVDVSFQNLFLEDAMVGVLVQYEGAEKVQCQIVLVAFTSLLWVFGTAARLLGERDYAWMTLELAVMRVFLLLCFRRIIIVGGFRFCLVTVQEMEHFFLASVSVAGMSAGGRTLDQFLAWKVATLAPVLHDHTAHATFTFGSVLLHDEHALLVEFVLARREGANNYFVTNCRHNFDGLDHFTQMFSGHNVMHTRVNAFSVLAFEKLLRFRTPAINLSFFYLLQADACVG